jgi:hypothetical protein
MSRLTPTSRNHVKVEVSIPSRRTDLRSALRLMPRVDPDHASPRNMRGSNKNDPGAVTNHGQPRSKSGIENLG